MTESKCNWQENVEVFANWRVTIYKELSCIRAWFNICVVASNCPRDFMNIKRTQNKWGKKDSMI